MTAIKAILFDMDGVLIDAREWHYEALNKTLRLFGFEISRYDHLVTYDGLPTRTKLKMLETEMGLPSGLSEFVNQIKQRYTMEMVHQLCRPTFKHERALSKLKAEGYRLAVCSNSIEATVRTMLEKAELIGYVEFYLSNEQVKNPKPDPEIYLTAIRRMQLDPSQCLIVEDNEHGVKAAIASGAHVLRVHDVHDVSYANLTRFIAEVEARA